MTKNRARIRAAKSLATTSDIRHPDASYLADHRKLRLPDGTVHDFTQGPLRVSDGAGTTRSQAAIIQGQGATKGWTIAQILVDNSESLLQLIPERPCLVFLVGVESASSYRAAELAAANHPDLNMVIVEGSSTDHRVLFVERGEYNFAAGPLHIAGDDPNFVTEQTQDVVKDAESKGWRVITAESAHQAGVALGDLSGPTLLVLNVNSREAYGSLDPLTLELIEGKHRNVNVLTAFHFAGGILTGSTKPGKSICMVPTLEVATTREWVMLRIAFVRRFADLHRAGGDVSGALIAIADEIERLGPSIHASSLMSQALKKAAATMKTGAAAREVWAPHQEILGSHLVRMLTTDEYGEVLAKLLSRAAETLEADLRIGLA